MIDFSKYSKKKVKTTNGIDFSKYIKNKETYRGEDNLTPEQLKPYISERSLTTGEKEEIRGGSFQKTQKEVDHIIPISLGGTDVKANLQALKSNKTISEKLFDIISGKERMPANYEPANRQEGKMIVEWSAIEAYKRNELTLEQAREVIKNYKPENKVVKFIKDFKEAVFDPFYFFKKIITEGTHLVQELATDGETQAIKEKRAEKDKLTAEELLGVKKEDKKKEQPMKFEVGRFDISDEQKKKLGAQETIVQPGPTRQRVELEKLGIDYKLAQPGQVSQYTPEAKAKINFDKFLKKAEKESPYIKPHHMLPSSKQIDETVKNIAESTASIFLVGTSFIGGLISQAEERKKQQNEKFLSSFPGEVLPSIDVLYNDKKAEEFALKVANTKQYKKIVDEIEKGTSDLWLKALASSKTLLTSLDKEKLKKAALSENFFEAYKTLNLNAYDEFLTAMIKDKENPNNSYVKNLLYNLQDSGLQSLIGMALSVAIGRINPTVGRMIGASYWTAISSAEQVQERGEVYSLEKIAIDVFGDMMIDRVASNLLKNPTKIIPRIAEGFVVEGGTEVMQSFGKYAVDYQDAKTDDEKQKVYEELVEYMKSEAMLTEFLVGGITGGTLAAFISGGININSKQVKEIEEDIKNIEERIATYRLLKPSQEKNEILATLEKAKTKLEKVLYDKKVKESRDLKESELIDETIRLLQEQEETPEVKEQIVKLSQAKEKLESGIIKDVDQKDSLPYIRKIGDRYVVGYHIPRQKGAKKLIESNGFNLENFGISSGTKEVGDPMGVYFFPSREAYEDSDLEDWNEMAKQFGSIESMLDIKNPFIIKSKKDFDKYFEIVKKATNTKAENLMEYKTTSEIGSQDSEKITKEFQKLGYDAIIDEKAMTSFEPQIIIFDPQKILFNLPTKDETYIQKEIEDSLIKKTSKYNSLEEFVNAQGKTYYRATEDGKTLGMGERWAWVDKEVAEKWAKRNNAKVIEFIIPDEAIDSIDLQRIKEGTTDRFKFDTSKAQTKSQLVDIWNKAQDKSFIKKEDLTQEAKILRGTKGMTADDIMKTYPNIQLKRDVPASTIDGEKTIISKGEKLTPYELKGNKILLQDGETYIVSKNQFQNIKGQSVVAEGKPFAPELEGVDETIKEDKTALRDKLYVDADAGIITITERNIEIEKLDKPNKTKHSQYQLPGGKNYKEILIKAPDNKKIAIDQLNKLLLEEGNTPKEKELLRQQIAEARELHKDSKNFESSHWDEPNVIAHIRLNERTYNDKKVTFLEELQSDWAREGRKFGFLTKDLSPTEFEKEWERMTLEDKKTALKQTGSSSDEFNLSLKEMSGSQQEALIGWIRDKKNINLIGVPNHPLLKNWQELALKRALIDAVQNDSDYFAWINGEQTSARYDLATYVDDVNWSKSTSIGEKRLVVQPKNGRTIETFIEKDGTVIASNDWSGKKLDEVLGKGLADKIMEKESGTLSGEGLKFGGEWAYNLYDRQVKNIVKDLTGQESETIDLGLPVETDKRNKVFTFSSGRDVGGFVQISDLKEGLEITNTEGDEYKITEVLSNGEFRALPINVENMIIDEFNFRNTLEEGGDGKVYSDLTKQEQEDYLKSQRVTYEETFNIDRNKKTSVQQGIRLTPDVKARIRGEAPIIETSGRLFTSDQKKMIAESNLETVKEVNKLKRRQQIAKKRGDTKQATFIEKRIDEVLNKYKLRREGMFQEDAKKRIQELNKRHGTNVDINLVTAILDNDGFPAGGVQYKNEIQIAKLTYRLAGEHEFMHYVEKNFKKFAKLSKYDINELRNNAKKMLSEEGITNIEKREILATAFELYIAKRESIFGKVRSFFEDIIDYIKDFAKLTTKNDARQFFKDIQKGEMMFEQKEVEVKKIQVVPAIPEIMSVLQETKEEKIVVEEKKEKPIIKKVTREQLPVKEKVGKEKVSKLEARMKGALNSLTEENIDKLGLSTYNQMNKKDQLEKASKLVLENEQLAIDILLGKEEIPSGLLYNSIYLALQEKASSDFNKDLALKLASLQATRFGQEISMLTEAQEFSSTSDVMSLIKIHEKGVKKRTGKTISENITNEKNKINEQIKPTKDDWDSFINSIKC